MEGGRRLRDWKGGEDREDGGRAVRVLDNDFNLVFVSRIGDMRKVKGRRDKTKQT
jgi:hypothetical protein